MTHGSLFSGIGGFDLAAEWMGWNNKFHCEWNPFGQKILKHYWPDAATYTDITKSDFTIFKHRIDVLSGGFPCQPYSQAGKRLGKEDDRHLWPEMLRAIREIQPRWVVGENVRGLTNWNGGLVFDEVQADLEAQGYEVTPFLLPACAVNAPHRRDRIWFVAYNPNARTESVRSKRENPIHESKPLTNSNRNGHELRGLGKNRSENEKSESIQDQREWIWSNDRGISKQRDVADTENIRQKQSGEARKRRSGFENGNIGNEISPNANGAGRKECNPPGFAAKPGHRTRSDIEDWSNWPTQPPIRSGNDGFSTGLSGITVSKHRNESIKAYGNAIVPQVAHQIFKAIQQYQSNSL